MKRLVLCVALLALAGCTPDRLVVKGELLSKDGAVLAAFEITDAVSSVNTTGATAVALYLSAVDGNNKVQALKTWRVTTQAGEVPELPLSGQSDQAEEVKVSFSLLDSGGNPQNIGIECGAAWPDWPQWQASRVFTLASVEAGMVTLTLAVQGQGTVHPSPGARRYLPGMMVPVEAVPYAGWEFSGWQGDGVADAASASTDIAIGTADMTVTAVFTQRDWGTTAALYLKRNDAGVIADFDFGNRPLWQTWEGMPQEAAIADIYGFGLQVLPMDLSMNFVEIYEVNGEGEGEGQEKANGEGEGEGEGETVRDWYPLDFLNPVLTDVQFVGEGTNAETGADATFDFSQPFWLAGPAVLTNLAAAVGIYLPVPNQVDVYDGDTKVVPWANGYYLIGANGLRIADQSGAMIAWPNTHVSMYVVVEGGLPPITYQWCKGGTLPANYISGATNSVFEMPSVQGPDSGSYYCDFADMTGEQKAIGFATKGGP